MIRLSLLLCVLSFSTTANALLITVGDTLRADYDLSGDTNDGPYRLLGIRIDFCNLDSTGSSDCTLENFTDSFLLSIYGSDDSLLYSDSWDTGFSSFPNYFSQNLSTDAPGGAFGNIGYILLEGLTGSFDVTRLQYFGIEEGSPGASTLLYESTLTRVSDSDPSVVPIPAALWLFMSGLAGLGIFRRKRVA